MVMQGGLKEAETKHPVIFGQGSEMLFELGEIRFVNRDQCSSALNWKEWTRDDFQAANETGELAVKLIREEQMLALLIDGKIVQNQPVFGYQSAFSEKNGISLTLSLSGEMDFVSVYQHKEWWMRPGFGKRFTDIPENTQLIIFRRQKEYLCCLAVCGLENRADLKGCAEGMQLQVSSNLCGRMEIKDCVLICGWGENPYRLVEQMIKMALRQCGKCIRLRTQKAFPAVFEKLGWCTWDSLGQTVNEKAILDKMEEFREKEIPVSWVLIDDGWSKSNQERQTLEDLGADAEKFPHGLEHTVRVLKEKYGVGEVGVWQAEKGYWNGIEPASLAAVKLQPYIRMYPNGELAVKGEDTAAFGFWNTWHTELKKAGIDFVKVDGQSSMSLLWRGVNSYGTAARALHTGLGASAALHFNGQMINCMGMAPEDIWNRPNSALSRTSDDYTPTVSGSFGEHVLQNSYNSILHGCFYWGDWDMVWSVHPEAEKSILLRVMSGGPFYLSDALGKSDPDKIRPVILEDGTITRCQDVARPTLDCLTDAGAFWKRPLKIYNRYEENRYVAAFLDEKAQEEELAIGRADFPDAVLTEYWIYDWKERKAYLQGREDVYRICIQPGEARLFHLIPADGRISVVGIAEKYISRACIRKIREDNDTCQMEVIEGGTLSWLSREKICSVMINGKPEKFHTKDGLTSVFVSRQDFVQIKWSLTEA